MFQSAEELVIALINNLVYQTELMSKTFVYCLLMLRQVQVLLDCIVEVDNVFNDLEWQELCDADKVSLVDKELLEERAYVEERPAFTTSLSDGRVNAVVNSSDMEVFDYCLSCVWIDR